MRIAIVTPGVFPVPPLKGGSVEIAVDGLGKELSKYVETIIFSKQVEGLLPFERSGNRIDIRFPGSRKRYLEGVEKYIAKYKPSILQIENRPLHILYFRNRLPNAKLILSLHSLTFVEKIKRDVLAKAFSAADMIFVNSRYIKSMLQSLVPEAAPKLKVQYLGIEDRKFIDRFSEKGRRVRLKWRKKWGIEGKQVILFIGRLIPLKGLHLLLHSLPYLLQEHPNVHLLIVGSSHYGRQIATPYVQKLIQMSRPIAKHITFANYIPPNDVPKIYQAADLVVTPSIEKEAFGLVNVEASISGIPVISTNVGGIPEVISHGQNGYLIKPSDWEKQFLEYASLLLTNEELHESMGKSGQSIARERFVWSNNVLRYLQAYEQLLST